MRAAATSVVMRLQESGHEAYFAGGCVRDMLMRKRPSDYDVATSAEPKRVMALFRRTQRVGAKFGVVLVRSGGYSIEVATFRRDMEFADGRRPSAVEFTDAQEDAARRDFTINGMFYDPADRRVVDYVGGQDDLRRRIIRAIGKPQQRFAEDHLRLLRAVRFAARLDFEIDSATWAAMKAHAADIAKISPERIREELEAMLCHSTRARAFRDLCDCGVFGHLWPGAAVLVPHRDRITRHLSGLPKRASFDLALAVVLLPLELKLVEDACRALRCSNDTTRIVGWLHAHQSTLDDGDKLSLADLKLLMAHPAFGLLLDLSRAAFVATRKPLSGFRRIVNRVRRIPPDQVAPPPLVTGHDLERMGVPKGPIYKRVLEHVYYQQLNGDILTRPSALACARGFLRRAD